VDGPIKIGKADDVLFRARGIQTATPEKISILAVLSNSSHEIERQIHRRFYEFRIRGEWFEPADELLEFVGQVAEKWTGPQPWQLRKSGRPKRENQPRGAGTKDVFARLQESEVDRLDEIVAKITPATSRAAVIAHLIRQYISADNMQK